MQCLQDSTMVGFKVDVILPDSHLNFQYCPVLYVFLQVWVYLFLKYTVPLIRLCTSNN